MEENALVAIREGLADGRKVGEVAALATVVGALKFSGGSAGDVRAGKGASI